MRLLDKETPSPRTRRSAPAVHPFASATPSEHAPQDPPLHRSSDPRPNPEPAIKHPFHILHPETSIRSDHETPQPAPQLPFIVRMPPQVPRPVQPGCRRRADRMLPRHRVFRRLRRVPRLYVFETEAAEGRGTDCQGAAGARGKDGEGVAG